MRGELSDKGPRFRRWRPQTFADAFRGLKVMVQTQPNTWVYAIATLCAVGVSLWVGLGSLEWVAIVLAITGVWVAEAVNTAIECVVDIVSPEKQQLAGWAKDLAAGAVLLASIGALAIGLVILGPKLLAKI